MSTSTPRPGHQVNLNKKRPTQERADAAKRPPFSMIEPRSALLDAIGLVAAAALLADHRQLCLQRIEILDLALGLNDGLGKACDMFVEAGLVFPDLWRGGVVAFRLEALGAFREQGRQLLGGVLELRQRGIDGRLVIGLLTLDDRSQRAGVLAGFLHLRLGLIDLVLLRKNGTGTQRKHRCDNDNPLHRQIPQSRFVPVRGPRPADMQTPQAEASFRLRHFIRDYAGAVPRGSRSRPARAWPACRYGRFCTRDTALRRSR